MTQHELIDQLLALAPGSHFAIHSKDISFRDHACDHIEFQDFIISWNRSNLIKCPLNSSKDLVSPKKPRKPRVKKINESKE